MILIRFKIIDDNKLLLRFNTLARRGEKMQLPMARFKFGPELKTIL